MRWVVVFLFATQVFVAAQTFRGGIQGTVTDASGAAVPNAQITITGVQTGLTRVLTSDSAGNYSVAELPLGTYNVSVSKEGFQTRLARGVSVDVSAFKRLDLQLSPGQVKETVEVTADIPIVESTNTTVGGTIDEKRVAEMPVNGRDFTKLLVLVPGATGDPVGSTDSPGSFGLFSMNGNRGRSNNYLLDGTDMNDGYRNLPSINEAGVFGTPATVLPVDALAEIPVLSNVDAQYGRNSGAIVNLVTKSGTNEIHGSLYEFFRNNALDARNYFNTADQPRNKFHNNQFGGSFGGPLVKDRTFWFAAYEGQREYGSLPTPGMVPTQAEIADSLTRIGAINPVIQALLNRNPWGIALPASDGNVQFSTPFRNRADSVVAKLDQHLGGHERHDLLTVRYFFGDSDQSFPLGLVGGGNSAPGYNTVTPTRVNIASLSYVKLLTNQLVLEFRGGYNRFDETFFPEDRGFDPRTIGLNTLPPDANPRDFALPLVSIAGYNSFGATPSVPRGRVDTNSQFFTNLSYNAGKHAWKWGYEYRRTTVNGFFDAGYRGRLGFDATEASGTTPAFSALDNFLMGIPTGSSRSATGDSHRVTHQNNHSFYIQDNFRVFPRLTLNYGLRYDYLGVISEALDRFSILDDSGTLVRVGTNGLERLYPRDWNNFAPRLGLAWDMFGTGRSVLRAGWGLFYDSFSQDFFVGQLPFNTFNPGPAYNGVPGSEVGFVFSANPITPATQVFTGYSASDVFTVDQRLRTPYVQNYNLNVQHELARGVALQIGYVGSAGRKLFRYRDINQVRPDGTVAFPAFVYVNQFESTANSNYNSLQTSLRLAGFHGLNSTFNYTWAHSIDNASDGQDYVPNASQPDNSFDTGRERASSNFDTRHRVQWYWTYELPFAGSRLVSGWMINGVFTLSTGQPVNVNYLFEGDFNGSGEFFGRPDLIGDPWAGTRTPDRFLNLAAFAVPCTWDSLAGDCVPGTQHFGNLGRNAFRGPDYTNWDLSVAKNTKLTERLSMQLRVDFFNILNHPNFSNPLLPNFGVDFLSNGSEIHGDRMTGTGFLPITATPDVGTGNPFLGGGGPRNIQIAAKFTF